MTILIFLHFWDAWIYITFSILQNFSLWKLSYLKYDNLNMTIFLKNSQIWQSVIWYNYFKVDKIWQFAIWQLIRKNCHISISKYDKKNQWKDCVIDCVRDCVLDCVTDYVIDCVTYCITDCVTDSARDCVIDGLCCF